MFQALAPIGFVMEHVYSTPYHGNHCLICRSRSPPDTNDDYRLLSYLYPDSSYLNSSRRHPESRACFLTLPISKNIRIQLFQKYNFADVRSLPDIFEHVSPCRLVIGDIAIASLVAYENKNAKFNDVVWNIRTHESTRVRLGHTFGPGYVSDFNKAKLLFKHTIICIFVSDISTMLELLIQPGHRSLQELLTHFEDCYCDTNTFVDPAKTFFGHEIA